MKKLASVFALFTCIVFTARAGDIILSNTGNPGLDGIYKSSGVMNDAEMYIKKGESGACVISRFEIESGQNGEGVHGWLIIDATGATCFGVTSEVIVPPAEGWDVGRGGVGLNANFEVTFQSDDITLNRAFTMENQPVVALKVFPNPTTGILTVDTESAVISIRLINISGQALLTSNETTLDLSGLPDGVYTLVVQTTTGQVARKIVKR
jgi:Secretion system C-terminal sorting domain